MREENLNLGKGAIGPLLFRMSLPSIAAMLVLSAYNIVDIFWLSKVSIDAVAALTMSFPIQLIVGAIGVGMGIGAGSFTARMFGAGSIRLAKKMVGQTITYSIIFGLLTIVMGMLVSIPFLKILGADTKILSLSKEYLFIYFLCAPLILFVITVTNLFRAEGKPNISMYVIITSGLIGIILDPFLILGWGPFPCLGVKGAALALGIGQLITVLLVFWIFCTGKSRYELKWEDLIPDPAIVRSVYHVGFPVFMMNLTLSIVFAVFNYRLENYGPASIAVLGLIFRINSIVSWVLFGIGHGVMPLVGFNYGAHFYERLKTITRKAMIVSLIIGGASFAFLSLFARPLIMSFTSDPLLIEMAVPALRIYSTSLITIGPVIIWISMFNGLGKGFTSMFFLALRDTVFLIPLLFLLPLRFDLNGIWWAQPISNGMIFILLYFRARKELKALDGFNGSAIPAV
jgi:putative MATE family efflux protein